jgi:hypothetical protein
MKRRPPPLIFEPDVLKPKQRRTWIVREGPTRFWRGRIEWSIERKRFVFSQAIGAPFDALECLTVHLFLGKLRD